MIMDLNGICQIKNLIEKNDNREREHNPMLLAYKVHILHVGNMFVSKCCWYMWPVVDVLFQVSLMASNATRRWDRMY